MDFVPLCAEMIWDFWF